MKKKINTLNPFNVKENEYYPTPYGLTRSLLNEVSKMNLFSKNDTFLEPCCGKDNAIVRVLKDYNFKNIGFYDLNYGTVKIDFFTELNQSTDWIITNPPFSISDDFIFKCKAVCKKGFILLLPLTHFGGEKRFLNGTYWGLEKILYFTRQVNLRSTYYGDEKNPPLGLRKDGKYYAGALHLGWFIFTKKTSDKMWKKKNIIIKQISNNKDIFRKEEINENL